MILYSKSGEFLGIGREELSFLGYEDLEDFKSIHNDVADLFVNRPGYIFKFKKFSWIDYTLHSGAPKKSVILQLKTGNEVETNIKIKELFLNNPKENEDIYYSVEFTNSLIQNTLIEPTGPTASASKIVSPEPLEEKAEIMQPVEETQIPMSSYNNDFKDDFEEKAPLILDESSEDTIGFKSVEFTNSLIQNTLIEPTGPTASAPKIVSPEPLEEKEEIIQPVEETKIPIPSYDHDFKDDFEEKAPLILDESSEDAIVFKKDDSNESLKIQSISQNDFMQDYKEETLQIDEKEDFTEDYKEIKLDIQNEEKNQKIVSPEPIVSAANDDITIKLKEDFNPTPIVQEEEEKEENFDFDILECVEELGLDIGLVSELLSDYIEKLTQTIPLLKLNIKNNNKASLEENIYNLKGISDNLHVNQISNKLTDILQATNTEQKDKEVEKFEKIVTKFKGELI